MSKPFQFSMGRMLGAVAIWCIAARLFEVLFELNLNRDSGVALLIAMSIGATTGLGFGVIVDKPAICATAGVVLAVGSLAVFLLWRLTYQGI